MCFLVKVATKADDESADFFGKFSPPALIGIFGGAFIALIIGFICICVFVRRMQKRDAEEAANQHTSIGASVCGYIFYVI